MRNAIDHLKTNVGTTITQLNDLASALNGSADNIDANAKARQGIHPRRALFLM